MKLECINTFSFCLFISMAFRVVLHVIPLIEHIVVLFGQTAFDIIPKSVINTDTFLCSIFSDIFSQISDSSGTMVFPKFDQFLREVLKLPTAVFEGPSFGYTEHSVRTCFPQQVRIFLTQHL